MSQPLAAPASLAPSPLPKGASAVRPATENGYSPLPMLASSALLQGQSAVLIEHLGQHYRLQATRQGKLILTK